MTLSNPNTCSQLPWMWHSLIFVFILWCRTASMRLMNVLQRDIQLVSWGPIKVSWHWFEHWQSLYTINGSQTGTKIIFFMLQLADMIKFVHNYCAHAQGKGAKAWVTSFHYSQFQKLSDDRLKFVDLGEKERDTLLEDPGIHRWYMEWQWKNEGDVTSMNCIFEMYHQAGIFLKPNVQCCSHLILVWCWHLSWPHLDSAWMTIWWVWFSAHWTLQGYYQCGCPRW